MKNVRGIVAVVFAAGASHAAAQIWTFNDPLDGLQEVPQVVTPGFGTIVGTYDQSTRVINYTVTFQDLIGTTTVAHFHGPAAPGVSAGVTIGVGDWPAGLTSGSHSASHVLTLAQEAQLLAGLWYFNVHSTFRPGGEIRGQVYPVPAPGAAALLALGGLALTRRRR